MLALCQRVSVHCHIICDMGDVVVVICVWGGQHMYEINAVLAYHMCCVMHDFDNSST